METVVQPMPLPYDVNKGRQVMSECERNINFARMEEIHEEWEERIAVLRYFTNHSVVNVTESCVRTC